MLKPTSLYYFVDLVNRFLEPEDKNKSNEYASTLTKMNKYFKQKDIVATDLKENAECKYASIFMFFNS